MELIEEIHAQELSGALRVEREKLKAVLYLEDGEIVYASSNTRLHRLSACLQRWGIVSETDLSAISDLQSDSKISAALVEKGLLSQQEVEATVARQVTEILRSVLLWIDGNWTFDPRIRLVEGVRVNTNRSALIIEAARHLPQEFILTRLTNREETLFPEASKIPSYDLLPTEAFVLSRIDTPMTMSELIQGSGLPELDTLRMVYSLALGGYLRRKTWPKAFSSDALAKAKSAKAQIPKQSTPPEQVLTKRADLKESGLDSEKSSPTTDNEQQELDRFFAHMSAAANYYEVLGVRPRATLAEIKSAYHSLAKKFHPDRYHGETEKGLYGRIGSAFAEIARAYETLKEKQSRSGYDLRLENQKKQQNRVESTEVDNAAQASPDSSPSPAPTEKPASKSEAPSAQVKFDQGIQALNAGNLSMAIVLLGEAAMMVPTEPRYRAFYGQALGRDGRTRRNAEAEILAAIALDGNNASYRVMLAELYLDLGFSKRATGELERALLVEPRNNAARRLLNEVRGSGS